MSANLNELREVSTDELQTVEGGWGRVVQRFLKYAAELPPSTKDEFISTLTPTQQNM